MQEQEATKVSERSLHRCWLYRYHIAMHLIVGIAMLWLLWTCVLRYRVFGTSVDLAIFTQFCWLLSHGKVMTEATFNRSVAGPQNPSSPLADHMALVLLPIAFIYKLFPSPVTLIVIQTLAVWLSVFGLWRVARLRLKNDIIALLLSMSFALYTPFHFQARNDFHTDVFAMVAIIWLWMGVVERKQWLFWLCLITALSARETAALPLIVLGAMLFLRRDERWFGAVILMVSGIWFVLCNGLLLPWLRAGKQHAGMLWAYGYLGNSVSSALLAVLTSPSRIAPYLLSTDTLLAAIQLVAPLLFLPILSPKFTMPALVIFITVFISRFAPMRNVAYQGLMPCAGLLALACIEAIVTLDSIIAKMLGNRSESSKIPLLNFGLATTILASTMVCWRLVSPRYLYLRPDHPIRDPKRLRALRAVIQAIPPDAPVVVSSHLAAHVASRRWVWLFKGATPLPEPFSSSGVIPIPSEIAQKSIYVLVQRNVPDAWQPMSALELSQIKRLRGVKVLIENEYVLLIKYDHPELKRIENSCVR